MHPAAAQVLPRLLELRRQLMLQRCHMRFPVCQFPATDLLQLQLPLQERLPCQERVIFPRLRKQIEQQCADRQHGCKNQDTPQNSSEAF